MTQKIIHPRTGGPLSQTVAGHGGPLPDRWQLLRAVERARRPLGLKATSLNILRAMLSFLPDDRLNAARADNHICFASNRALAERAHVSVQTVERHVGLLVKLGLIDRHASANGKRWARRDRLGRVVLATGLSLLPLLNRHEELRTMGDAQEDRETALRVLRDRCRMAVAQLKEQVDGVATSAHELIDRAFLVLRRKSSAEALEALHADLLHQISEETPVPVENLYQNNAVPRDLRGNDTAIEGHKETDINPEVRAEPPEDVDMERAFPRLCARLRACRTLSDCHDRMDRLAREIGLRRIWPEIRALGPQRAFMLLGYLHERTEKLRNANAYARMLLSAEAQGRLDWRSLLKGQGPRDPLPA
ncbi:helix-turn-helix domain-containing protein [Sagittula salina]|uniref:Helix-turn-helix domain-containing protein n=1 Tax=Sagittula salina TaxID=2820268 RepID=A0A940RZM8_9RHOB|nr:helix-turn-helix domain-containing protein [Sagittula salina]MBP0482148.1 helix-turn-helix domain-containing protein [Sagittula salina]